MEAIAETLAQLVYERGKAAELEGRTIRLTDPVGGDPGAAMLGILGSAQDDPPVGAAAHGPGAVVMGVWHPPHLYVARWSNVTRWVIGYRLPASARPDRYIRAEGRIPSHLEHGRWADVVPDEVVEAFADVGLSFDEPPFPPPPRPAPKAAPAQPARKASSSGPSRTRAAARPKPAPRTPKPTVRLCPACHMQKALPQFVAGSDLCNDCR